MNLVKYSPRLKQIQTRHNRAHKLGIGFIRQIPSFLSIPYCIISLIFNYWITIVHFNVLQLNHTFYTNREPYPMNECGSESSTISTVVTISNFERKIGINIGSEYTYHLYPQTGQFIKEILSSKKKLLRFSDKGEIRTTLGNKWVCGESKSIQLTFHLYKASACKNKACYAKNDHKSYLQVKIGAGDLFEGSIYTQLSKDIFEINNSLSVYSWDGQIKREGWIIGKSCAYCSVSPEQSTQIIVFDDD